MLRRSEGATVDIRDLDGGDDPVPVSDSGQATDFAAWVAPHLPVLGALASRQVPPADAADLLQDTLVRAWRKQHTFRDDKGTARSWLIAILLDQSRRRRVRARPEVATADPEPPPVSDPTDDHELDAAISRLPDRQRQVIELYYLADLPVSEVAKLLGIAEGTVKSQLSDARAALRRTLEDQS